MEEQKEEREYLVQTDEVQCLVIADNWTCSGNGLRFFNKGETIGWFLSWKFFVRLEKGE